MDWCRKQPDNSVSGILALFSIYHIPRNHHVDLFTHVARIMKENAPLLFTTGPRSSEGFQDEWFGCSKMYWSSFSVNWYEVTCEDLGFEFVSKYKELKDGETNYYLLYRKPVAFVPRYPSQILMPPSPGFSPGFTPVQGRHTPLSPSAPVPASPNGSPSQVVGQSFSPQSPGIYTDEQINMFDVLEYKS